MIVEVLFPEIGNLYGDLQNVEYFKRSVADVKVVETSLKDKPYFADHDDFGFVYMGTMTERSQELALNALRPYKDRLVELINNNKVFLITGNALELFGEYIECDDGSKIECLGIFKTHAVRRMLSRYNSLYVGKLACDDTMDIVGFKSQFTHSYGEHEALFNTVRGDGLSPEEKGEGIRKNNFLGTYIIGPLLILNPPFTEYLGKLSGASEVKLAYKEAAMDVYNHRVSEFMEPTRGLTY